MERGFLFWAGSRTLSTLGWPKAIVVAIGLVLIAGTAYSAIAPRPLQWSEIETFLAILLATSGGVCVLVFSAYLLVAPYVDAIMRAARAEAELARVLNSDVDEQTLMGLVGNHAEGAHTFIHYNMSTQVSLSQNIAAFIGHNTLEFSLQFQQPIEPGTIVVRPFGGTPRFKLVAVDALKARIKFEIAPDIIKLRILGHLVPRISKSGHLPNLPDVKGIAHVQTASEL
jgi:hypothetical protein